MVQTSQTGAEANAWGRKTARLIAAKLGATEMASNSNECTLNGVRVVIKVAAPKTTSVGVTYKMLEHIQLVIGAFQVPDLAFELFSLSAEAYSAAMTETASTGSSAGKVGKVSKHVFEARGKSLGRIETTG